MMPDDGDRYLEQRLKRFIEPAPSRDFLPHIIAAARVSRGSRQAGRSFFPSIPFTALAMTCCLLAGVLVGWQVPLVSSSSQPLLSPGEELGYFLMMEE